MEEGYREGYERASAEVRADFEEKLGQLAQAMALFDESLRERVQQVDRYAVDLAFAALTRIVGEQRVNSLFSNAVISEALSAVRGSGAIVVRISQGDFDALESLQEELASAGRFSDIKLVPDPRVSLGGCLIETDNGTWDARLETQLLRLKDAVEQSQRERKQ